MQKFQITRINYWQYFQSSELQTVKGAYDRRLQRLKSLQQNYRLLKEEKQIEKEEKGLVLNKI